MLGDRHRVARWRALVLAGVAMIRSYNHKGYVLEVAVEVSCRLVSPAAPEPPLYLAVVTISRSGRPVTAFSPLQVAQQSIRYFDSPEDALMSGHSAGQSFVDDWMRSESHTAH
jgi:hypothetical protein